VLDLAAGTGKLTRSLRASGARVVAVEPLPELRARLDADEVLAGTAEAIPLADGAVDLVTVGDAWHWFDWARAAAELARVVRPGGAAALLWQTPGPDRAPGWRRDVGRLLRGMRGDHPNFRDDQGRPALDAHPAFDGLREHTAPFTWRPGEEELLDCVCSFSFIGAMDDSGRAAVREQVRALLPGGPLEWPYETRVWTTRRRVRT